MIRLLLNQERNMCIRSLKDHFFAIEHIYEGLLDLQHLVETVHFPPQLIALSLHSDQLLGVSLVSFSQLGLEPGLQLFSQQHLLLLELKLKFCLPKFSLFGQLSEGFIFGSLQFFDTSKPLSLHGLDSLLILLFSQLQQSSLLFELLENLLVGKLVLLNSLEGFFDLAFCFHGDPIIMRRLVLLELVHEVAFLFLDLFDPQLLIFLESFESFLPPDDFPVDSFVFLLKEAHSDGFFLDLLPSFLEFNFQLLFVNVVVGKKLLELLFAGLPVPSFLALFALSSSDGGVQLLVDSLQLLVLLSQLKELGLSFLVLLLSISQLINVLVHLVFQVLDLAFEFGLVEFEELVGFGQEMDSFFLLLVDDSVFLA